MILFTRCFSGRQATRTRDSSTATAGPKHVDSAASTASTASTALPAKHAPAASADDLHTLFEDGKALQSMPATTIPSQPLPASPPEPSSPSIALPPVAGSWQGEDHHHGQGNHGQSEDHDHEHFVSCAESFTSAIGTHHHQQHHASIIKLAAALTVPEHPQGSVAVQRQGAAAVANGAADGEEGRSGAPDAVQQQHMELLSTVARLYKKQGHPCSACQRIISYCSERHVAYEDLEATLTRVQGTTDTTTTTATPAPAPAPTAAHGGAAAAAPQPAGAKDAQGSQERAQGEEEGVASEEVLREMGADLERLVRAARDMSASMRTVLDDSGWQVCQDDALKMMHRHEHGSTAHGFKARCILDSHIENVTALVREFDLSKTWNRYCVESLILRQHSPAEMAVCAVMWMPWPLPNMNIVIEAVGTEVLEARGGFLITLATPTDEEEVNALLPEGIRNNVQPRMERGSCILLEPLPPSAPGGPPRTRATVEVTLDPGFHVPSLLIHFLLKVLGPFMYRIIAHLLKKEFSDPTKPLPARIPLCPSLYGLVRRRADEYLAGALSRGVVLPQPLAEVKRSSSSKAGKAAPHHVAPKHH